MLLLSLVLLSLPPAKADEALADCEPDQPWIGYRSTDPVRAIVDPALVAHGVTLDACEGEQWDGQDPLGPNEPANCAGALDLDPSRLHASFCQGPDPNEGWDNVTAPVGARVSSNDLREGYLALDLAFVARASVYAGTCGAGEEGLEGAASCGGTRELRTGIYVRDNTPGNAIVTALTCMRYVGCYVAESDCTHAVYLYGAYNPPSPCGRDNTAFGAAVVLP